MIKLLPHQESHAPKVVAKLCEPGNVVLDTSSTGTGKTYSALWAAQKLGVTPLVVCPLGAIPGWQAAAEVAEMDLPIIHYEGLLAQARQARARGIIPQWGAWERLRQRWSWDSKLVDADKSLIIFDEVHRLSGASSQLSKLLIACRDQEIPTLMLSATPFYSPLKMRAMAYRFGLTPNSLQATFQGWCLMHGCYYGGYNQITFEADEGPVVWQSISAETGGRIFGVDKNKVDGFPECQTITKFCPVTTPVDTYYAELTELELEADLPVVRIMRLRQKIEWAKVTSLVEYATDLESQGHSIPIFVSFKASADELARRLKCPVISGDTPQNDRDRHIRDFQSNTIHHLVLTMDSGAESISLHDLHGRPRVALVNPGWHSTTFVQCLGRIHRAGAQTKSTNIIVLAEGSAVESRVASLLGDKLSALEQITDSDLGAKIILDTHATQN